MALLIAMLGAMPAINIGNTNRSCIRKDITPNESEAIDKKLKLDKGLIEFHYDKGSIWARNQKNADRKAKNNNWL